MVIFDQDGVQEDGVVQMDTLDSSTIDAGDMESLRELPRQIC